MRERNCRRPEDGSGAAADRKLRVLDGEQPTTLPNASQERQRLQALADRLPPLSEHVMADLTALWRRQARGHLVAVEAPQ